MIFKVSLFISIIIFITGLVYKISNWFRYKIGIEAEGISTSQRLIYALLGIFSTLFSLRILTLLRSLILDVILQFRILREDSLRWIIHIMIYGGFMLLLFGHALDRYITGKLFEHYYSTINPFMFLRNVFGIIVIIGIIISVYRRFILKIPRLKTNLMDLYGLIIVLIIVLSGFFLESVKMISYTDYKRMVSEYSGLTEPDELKALEAYWVDQFGTVSPNLKKPFEEKLLIKGKELHQSSCVECHSKPQWAFLSYGITKLLHPFGHGIDRANLPNFLWYIHIFACLAGLAYLPFSKMFHIISSTISLLINSIAEKKRLTEPNKLNRRSIELDACTHCGTCTLRCSVAQTYEKIKNIHILPSEKISAIKTLASGRSFKERELRAIQEGVYLCTNCYRCTIVCPVGIDLQDLWFNVREMILKRGYPEYLILSPLSYYRGLMNGETPWIDYQKPLFQAREAIFSNCELMRDKERLIQLTPFDKEFHNGLALSSQAKNFSVCFGCQTCTTVCPVVANYENPQQILGLLPHQIMHATGLGLRDLAFGSNMLWDCLTCYQCQEQCPQGVPVTDVLYELKNLAIKYVKGKVS